MGNREEPLDRLAELDALVDIGRRAPGSDAERRAAQHLRGRLEALGRRAELEPVAAYPGWPLAYALLASASIAASVLAVYVPFAGAILALVAALLTFVDAGLLIPTARRLFGRRASQNVVSWDDTREGGAEQSDVAEQSGAHEGRAEQSDVAEHRAGGDGAGKPGALIIVAHYDAGRRGIAHSDAVARRRAPLRVGGLQVLFVAQLGVLAATLLRLVGLDGTLLTAAQFVPTFALIVAGALLADVALAGTKAGENDNASGAVLALRLAHEAKAGYFDVHVLLTGAATAGAAGMRAFLKRHELPRDSTVFLNLDQVGSGAVRYTRREGALLTARTHPQLTALGDQIVEDGDEAAPLVTRTASDASAAGGAGYAAITVTCRDRLDHASGRVHEQSLARAEAFCLELIGRLDAEVGPSIAAPVEATALSEP